MRPSDGGKGDKRRPAAPGVNCGDRFDLIFGSRQTKPAPRVIPRTLNVRHDFDPELVATHIEETVALHEVRRRNAVKFATELTALYDKDMASGNTRAWLRAPDTAAEVGAMWDRRIANELSHYALARVIERPDGKFILVYGDADDATVTNGTGPVDSVKKAADWFFAGGR